MTDYTEEFTVYHDIRRFVGFDETGRINTAGAEGLGFIRDRAADGQRVALGGTEDWKRDGAELYVDIPAGNIITLRPTLPIPQTSFALAPREVTTLTGIPPATIDYAGPVTGRATHEGGNVTFGFVLPGSYRLTIEAFPYKPVLLTVEVAL